MKTLKRYGRRLATGMTAIIGWWVTYDVMAQALPTVAPPSRGASSTNYIEMLQNYAFDIFIFAGLLLGSLGFLYVVRNTLDTYSQVPEGRATMGAVGLQAGAGVLILVFIVFLLTEASGIL